MVAANDLSLNYRANDPDADRLAAAEMAVDGSWRIFTGNELGVILGHHCMVQFMNQGHVPSGGLVLTTVVSTKMLSKMADTFGFQFCDTLTGFKWLANKSISVRKEKPDSKMVFMFEEALVIIPMNIITNYWD